MVGGGGNRYKYRVVLVSSVSLNVEVGDFGGWDIVVQRMKEASKITGNYIDFLKQVDLKTSLQTARDNVESWGQDTIDAAVAINSQVTQLSQYITEAKQTYKHTKEEAKQKQQQVRDGMHRVRQTQRDVQNKIGGLKDADSLRMIMDAKCNAKPRELVKAAHVRERAVEATKDAETQYHEAIIYHNEMVNAWCTYARPTLSIFQDKEEARVKMLRESLWSFANICSLLAVNFDQHQENIRSALLRVNVAKELSTWVAIHRTLQTPPMPLVYTPTSYTSCNTPSLTPSTSVRSTLTEVSSSSNSSDGSSPSESEVSLVEGQVITVMDKSNSEWNLVRTSNGVLGFVPAKFISSSRTYTK
ncbi:Proline-serine-threonine phosphatase-interacting protein 2-like [Homarus americanus]|uniref:Proline-serine-threonine phosphatase-interacting protein 2-like n=1 Tax=Homarus americanus TaxID=6706 RepID=A0A8J5JMT2_HOMAM|nr:Proline-serine-threonine phosphatase-interacting protein 2-like [Homarus americanus]